MYDADVTADLAGDSNDSSSGQAVKRSSQAAQSNAGKDEDVESDGEIDVKFEDMLKSLKRLVLGIH